MAREFPSIEEGLNDIEARKDAIASLPASADKFDRARLQKELGEKTLEYELTVERRRVEDIVKRHHDLHPPVTETCPICLDDVRIYGSGTSAMFLCCMNYTCKSCHAAHSAGGRAYLGGKCPLCRAEFLNSEMTGIERVMKHAKAGKASAQARMGTVYLYGTEGFPVDNSQAMKWLQLAADQQHAGALSALSEIYHEGYDELVEKSYEKAFSLLTQAADMGYAMAQYNLGQKYYTGEGGIEVDALLGMKYISLSYDGGFPLAASQLGLAYKHGLGGIGQHMHLAVHYLEEAANAGCERAYVDLALALVDHCHSLYGSIDIPGHSPIPKALFWLHRAKATDAQADELIEEIEGHLNCRCNNCHKEATSTLKKCVRCKAAWYCGKECQIEHWNSGHKVDCVKRK